MDEIPPVGGQAQIKIDHRPWTMDDGRDQKIDDGPWTMDNGLKIKDQKHKRLTMY